MKAVIILIYNQPNTFKKSEYRGATKKEIAKMFPISERTLRYYLNEKYFEGLSNATDYMKRQKILTPKQVMYLDIILDFWE